MGMLTKVTKRHTVCLSTAAGATPRSPSPSMPLCLKTFSLKLSSKPCLEEVDGVSHCHMRANVPEDLSRSPLETGSEMVKHVLVIPLQVTGYALKLCQERVQAPSLVTLL